MLHPRPVDLCDRGIGPFAGLGDCRTLTRHGQHPTTGRDQFALCIGVDAGAEDADTGHRRSRVEAFDAIAESKITRITLRRTHDRYGRAIVEGRSRAEIAGSGRGEKFAEIAREPRQHDLRLRIAEAHVVLEHLGPGGREHEAGYNTPR